MTTASPAQTRREALRAAIAPFIASFALMALSWITTGSSLGLFFAGLFLAAVLVPSMVLLHDATTSRVIQAIAIAKGIGLIWLIACFAGAISPIQWIACYLILAAWAIALAGFASLITRFRAHPIVASAITVIGGLLWLTWPVWLSPLFRESSNQSLINALVRLSPPLAVNGVLIPFGAWSQAAHAYHLTDLGQHIEYALPPHSVYCIVTHLLMGVALLVISRAKSNGDGKDEVLV